MSLSGYQKHVSSCSAPAPLTAAEQELQQIRINEVGVLHMGSNSCMVSNSWDGVQQLGCVQQGWVCCRMVSNSWDGVLQGWCAAGWCPTAGWVCCRVVSNNWDSVQQQGWCPAELGVQQGVQQG